MAKCRPVGLEMRLSGESNPVGRETGKTPAIGKVTRPLIIPKVSIRGDAAGLRRDKEAGWLATGDGAPWIPESVAL